MKPTERIENLLILICKQYVYACKCRKVKPSIQGLKAKVYEREMFERINCQMTSIQKKHAKKWEWTMIQLRVASATMGPQEAH